MVSFKLNGREVRADVPDTSPLLYVLTNDLGVSGAKYGCGKSQCGACTVLIEGEPVRSCATQVSAVAGRSVTTLEGLKENGKPSRLQQAFIDEQAGQCGYCLSGILASATALLARTPQPTEAQVREALDRHLCRCGAHNRIVRAVLRAASPEAAR